MTETGKKMCKPSFNLRSLRLSLKYRPEILKLILKMRQCIRKKNSMLIKLKHRLKELENNLVKDNSFKINITNCQEVDKPDTNIMPSTKAEDTNETSQSAQSIDKGATIKPKTKTRSAQTDDVTDSINLETISKTSNLEGKIEESAWKVNEENETKSIAEQVKEAAQDAIKQSGMVYVESAGMYYDYNTGYYYNSELGLYYHTDTDCYYYYSEDKQSFVFHSYPVKSAAHAALLAHEKRKARKHKMGRKTEEDIENLTKNLSQDDEEDSKDVKKRKCKKSKKKAEKEISPPNEKKDEEVETSEPKAEVKVENISENVEVEKKKEEVEDKETPMKTEELEDGECSDTSSEGLASDDNDVKSNASTSTVSDDDDESIAKLHPPCMRVIVRETSVPKLRVGSLFIVTKDGGTIGREGEHHTILLPDHNVSRNHLDIRYDDTLNSYIATDLGSKNGSILNGSRMSESQIFSEPMKVVHGSTLQVGETKLLCHVHPGNDTCGHCEPGLVMDEDKETKVAYTRTCSVKKQHELELARLKNKYGAKKLLAIEETAYNDRAKERRETVGSSHHAEKTQATDIDTSIAPDNKGFKLLEKMGWSKGEGLGKDSQGDVEPVPLISNTGKTGLGAQSAAPVVVTKKVSNLGPATMRLANRTKMLQPPAKVFQGVFDEDSE